MDVDPSAKENKAKDAQSDARVPPDYKKRGLRVLNSAHTRPLDHQEVLHTFTKGEVTDWDLWETVVDETF